VRKAKAILWLSTLALVAAQFGALRGPFGFFDGP
jgi:hypothetical protein